MNSVFAAKQKNADALDASEGRAPKSSPRGPGNFDPRAEMPPRGKHYVYCGFSPHDPRSCIKHYMILSCLKVAK